MSRYPMAERTARTLARRNGAIAISVPIVMATFVFLSQQSTGGLPPEASASTSPPNKPTVQAIPGDTFADVIGSAYNDDPDGNAHDSTRIRIARLTSDFSLALVDTFMGPVTLLSGGGSNIPLKVDTTYKADIRYKDDNDGWSEFSDSVVFTTASQSALYPNEPAGMTQLYVFDGRCSTDPVNTSGWTVGTGSTAWADFHPCVSNSDALILQSQFTPNPSGQDSVMKAEIGLNPSPQSMGSRQLNFSVPYDTVYISIHEWVPSNPGQWSRKQFYMGLPCKNNAHFATRPNTDGGIITAQGSGCISGGTWNPVSGSVEYAGRNAWNHTEWIFVASTGRVTWYKDGTQLATTTQFNTLSNEYDSFLWYHNSLNGNPGEATYFFMGNVKISAK